MLLTGLSCVIAQDEVAPVEEAPPVDASLRSILPADIYAVPGVEMNVYYGVGQGG